MDWGSGLRALGVKGLGGEATGLGPGSEDQTYGFSVFLRVRFRA